jgi:hypothetical protein
MATITPIAQDKPEKSLSSTKLGKNIFLSLGDVELAKRHNNDPIRFFEPKARRRLVGYSQIHRNRCLL